MKYYARKVNKVKVDDLGRTRLIGYVEYVKTNDIAKINKRRVNLFEETINKTIIRELRHLEEGKIYTKKYNGEELFNKKTLYQKSAELNMYYNCL